MGEPIELRRADPIVREYAKALAAEIRPLQRRIAKLESRDTSLSNRAKELERENERLVKAGYGCKIEIVDPTIR